jgi:hypothetical protein
LDRRHAAAAAGLEGRGPVGTILQIPALKEIRVELKQYADDEPG